MEIAHCFVLFSSVVIFTATPNIWMRKAKKNRQNVTVANQFTVQLQKVPTDAYLPWKIIFKIVFTLQIFENRLPSLVSSILGFSTTQSWDNRFLLLAPALLCAECCLFCLCDCQNLSPGWKILLCDCQNLSPGFKGKQTFFSSLWCNRLEAFFSSSLWCNSSKFFFK